MIKAVDFWNGMAEKYAKHPIADEKAYRQTLDRTRSYLSSTDSILEVGCGTGSTALLLAGDVAQITASDLSENMIGIGVEKATDQDISNVKFVAADLFDSALDDDPYDAVLALNVVHLLEDIPAAIARINNLLKPDGVFISKTVCQPESGMPFKFRIMKLVLPLMQLIGKAPYVNFLKTNELERIIISGGFEILESGSYPASSMSRYVVARRI